MRRIISDNARLDPTRKPKRRPARGRRFSLGWGRFPLVLSSIDDLDHSRADKRVTIFPSDDCIMITSALFKLMPSDRTVNWYSHQSRFLTGLGFGIRPSTTAPSSAGFWSNPCVHEPSNVADFRKSSSRRRFCEEIFPPSVARSLAEQLPNAPMMLTVSFSGKVSTS